ncbi:ATP-dependent zinc metalloprotease FTSH 4, mitochondrial [Cymbomonas tetramitiformis]|uniref:ATP-dependent zinc metalloprotease FTSH 4, mitochondrial n=1 Tax=Cymbomonas tetramitiformis TaxID=36881 RepID=A0AAE0GL77_9CHLO|nr:ATP-dependent zinc metalloprotease FTSH 4, mitochondrial [Cymbomonas tetramitiformis]
MQDLNRSDPEGVVRAFESGSFAQTEANLAEYVKALVKLDRLDNNAMLQAVKRGSFQSASAPGSWGAAAAAHATPFAGAAAEGLGTSANPIFTAQSEQSFKVRIGSEEP